MIKLYEISYNQSRALIPPLEAKIKTALHRLGTLLGKDPTSLYPLLRKPQQVPEASPEILVDLPSTLLQRRPDIRQAERLLASATANIGVARADLFPKFFLTGQLSYESTKTNKLFSHNSKSWSIGPSISLPIFDFGKIQANIEHAFALKEQAFLEYKNAILLALEDTENALVNYTQEYQHYEEVKNALKAAQHDHRLAKDLFQSGLNNQINTLQTENIFYNAQIQLIQSKTAIALNLVALYKALGGGWTDP